MNGKLAAGLIVLLILSQGYINYKLAQTQQAIVGVVYLAQQADGGAAFLQDYFTEQRKQGGAGLSGIESGTAKFMPVQNTVTR